MFAQESVMDLQKIKELALANGFSLKEQASGNMDLHSYVYEFANAIEQAVKAQAVPEGFGDIQSWIAVNSFSALDASIVDFPVVDANELAEFIDSLNIDVAVPEGFVLVPMVPSERMINAVRQCYEGEAYLPYSLYSEFVNQAIIERMEAQEPAND